MVPSRAMRLHAIHCCLVQGPDGDDVLPPYQEDIRRHHAGPDGAGGNWEASPMSGANWIASMPREAKTTSRTYTDGEGNVITEVCLFEVFQNCTDLTQLFTSCDV
jgi:hypothetical protein